MNKDWNPFKMNKLKDLTSIGFADIAGNGITAIFWFVIAASIEPDYFGQIHYFLGVAGLAQIISLIGNSNVLTVYVAKNIKIQSTLLLFCFIASTISAIIVFVLFFRIDVSLLIFGYVIFDLGNGIIFGRKRYTLYSKYILIQKILTVVFGLGFYHLFGKEFIIFGLAMSYLPYIIIIIREFKGSSINFSQIRKHGGFIFNNYSMNLAAGSAGQIDKLVIAPILGFVILGNYSLALQLLSMLMMFSGIIYKYTLPHDASGNTNKKLKTITMFISIGIAVFGITVLPLVIPIIFPKFIDAIDAIRIMSFAIIPGTLSLLFQSKLLGMEKSRFVLISKIISTSTLVIGFIIIGPIAGTVGLATILVLSSIIEASFLATTSRRVYK